MYGPHAPKLAGVACEGLHETSQMIRCLRDPTHVAIRYPNSRFNAMAAKSGNDDQLDEDFVPPHLSGPHLTLIRCKEDRTKLEQGLRALEAAAKAVAAGGSKKRKKNDAAATATAAAALEECKKKLANATQMVRSVKKRCTELEQLLSDTHVSNVNEACAVSAAFLQALYDDPLFDGGRHLKKEIRLAKEAAAEAKRKDEEFRRKMSEGWDEERRLNQSEAMMGNRYSASAQRADADAVVADLEDKKKRARGAPAKAKIGRQLVPAKKHAKEAAVKDEENSRKKSEAGMGKAFWNSSGGLTGIGKHQQLQPLLDDLESKLKKSKVAGTKALIKTDIGAQIMEVAKQINVSKSKERYRAKHAVSIKQQRDEKNTEEFKKTEALRKRKRRLELKEKKDE